MDFVVVGFGLGALGVCWAWSCWAGWRHGLSAPPRESASPDDAAHALAVAAEHRGTGRSFLFAGAAMLLATIGALAGSLDDRTGALLVTTTATVAAIGILLGGYLHRAPQPPATRRRAASAGTSPTRAAEPSPRAPQSRSPSRPTQEWQSRRAWIFSLDDDGDARFDPVPTPEEVPEAKLETAVPDFGSQWGVRIG